MPTYTPNEGSRHDLTSFEYTTESLDLAAWLVCEGFPLLRLDPPTPHSPKPLTRFVFGNSDDLSEAVDTWEGGQPVRDTDLRRYISTRKELYRRARHVASSHGEVR